MLGKKFTKNLVNYIDPLFNIPVYSFDRNQERELPCIIVGYTGETTSIAGGQGHYTVAGYVTVGYQGYEDADNSSADADAEIVVDALISTTALLSSMNAPLTGTDTRPLSGIKLNGLIIREVTRDEQNASSFITISFDAYTAYGD